MLRLQRDNPSELIHKHPALPAGYAQPVTSKVENRFHSGDWIHRLPAPGSHPGEANFIPVPARKVNAIPVGRPAFEHLVPSPDNIQKLKLVDDEILKGTLQEASTSLVWYAKELERRRQTAEQGEEYTLPALGPTLINMRLFIDHLLGNRHFTQPLNDGERRALKELDEQAAILLRKEVPYKRTVLLSFVFVTLYDLLVQQRVLAPLVQQQPDLTQKRSSLPTLWPFGFYTRPEDLVRPPQPVASMDPEQVVSCYRRGLNPEALEVKDCLRAHYDSSQIISALPMLLNNPSVFLYPSWQPLDIDDFCNFGHLPVYPLGLIPTYAANADGCMNSPLQFMVHDMFHISYVESYLYIEGSRPLETPANRCAFRQLLVNVPKALAHLHLEKAVYLLVFNLLHEQNPGQARNDLENESFVPLMWIQAEVRRERWCDYSLNFQGIKDDEGTIAALWIHRLFAQWKTSGLQLTDAQRDRLADQFLTCELPELRWHLEYLARHKARLRELFLPEAEDYTLEQTDASTGNRHFRWARGIFFKKDFFHWQEPHGGCCVDHSDVVYFDRLHQHGGREQMAQATGSPILWKTPF